MSNAGTSPQKAIAMSLDPSRRTVLKSVATAVTIPTVFNPLWLSAQNTPLQATQQDPMVKPKIENTVAWYDASQWTIEGKGWVETLKPFDRLPRKAESMVRPAVWNLSRNSAGMKTGFATNSNEIRVRYRLSNARLAMPHMPATGVSGVDLYAKNANGKSRWVNVTRPSQQDVAATLANGIDVLPDNAAREFSLYLPLYNGVEKLEIGVPSKFSFKPIVARDKPILFYGTSIMHGACASRPGMSISAILGRRFDRPVINLGFSGNGKMEVELAQLIGELSPAAIAVDCLPNMNPKLVSERAVPFVTKVRELLKDAPILLVEDRNFTNSSFFIGKRKFHEANQAALKKAFEQLKPSINRLSYLQGANLLGDDGDGATDGSHPNDMGMMRYADA